MSIHFEEKKFTLDFAPLLHLSDFTFRNVFHRFWGGGEEGMDTYMAPFVSVTAGSRLRRKSYIDIAPENNCVPLIPQLLSNRGDELVLFGRHCLKLGYDEMNWNLGCPYPAITRHARGSGMLAFPGRMDSILDQYGRAQETASLSLKMRLGVEFPEELQSILSIIKQHDIRSLTVHVRTAADLYTGPVKPEFIQPILDEISVPVIYNGELKDWKGIRAVLTEYPGLSGIAVGRGFLERPWIIREWTESRDIGFEEVEGEFWLFHDALVEAYGELFPRNSSLLGRFKELWSYFRRVTPRFSGEFDIMKKIGTWDDWSRHIDNLKNLS